MLKTEWIPQAYKNADAQQPPITTTAGSTKPKRTRAETLQINKKKYRAPRPSK